jgi:hypothetical protein
MATVQTMTLEEKQNLVNLLSIDLSAESVGFGISIFDNNGTWMGGYAYKTSDLESMDSSTVIGGIIPEYKILGMYDWVEKWSDIVYALFEARGDIFTIDAKDKEEANLYKKLGHFSSSNFIMFERVVFAKHAFDDFARKFSANPTRTLNYVKVAHAEAMPSKWVMETTDDMGNTTVTLRMN